MSLLSPNRYFSPDDSAGAQKKSLGSGIYYQAMRLWLTTVPFYPHPDKKETPHAVKT